MFEYPKRRRLAWQSKTGMHGRYSIIADIARQLRQMAAGAPPFKRFTYTSLWIKRIWLAAAEELDPEGR